MDFKNIFLGLFLLPFVFGFTLSFLDQLLRIRFVGYGEMAFFGGLFLYPLFHLSRFKPRFLSTFSHEMTHVLWGAVFRARIRGLSVRRESGYVSLTKSNFVIRLAPYFFPLLTAFILLLALFLKEDYLLELFFLTGFTLSHHITSTLESLKVKQPDILPTGILLSLLIITMANFWVVMLVLKLVSPANISLSEFLKTGFMETVGFLSYLA